MTEKSRDDPSVVQQAAIRERQLPAVANGSSGRTPIRRFILPD
jgi:hypothetical protein